MSVDPDPQLKLKCSGLRISATLWPAAASFAVWKCDSSSESRYSSRLWITVQWGEDVTRLYLVSCTGSPSTLAPHLRTINSLLCAINSHSTFEFIQKDYKQLGAERQYIIYFRAAQRFGASRVTHKLCMTRVWQRGLWRYMVHITIIYDRRSLHIWGSGSKDLDFSFIAI